MALINTQVTADARNPMGSTYSFSANGGTGNDRCITVILAIPAASVSSITFAGQSLTKKFEQNTAYSTFWSVWELKNSAAGINILAVTLSTGVWNNISTVVYAFSGCNGINTPVLNNVQASNQTVTVPNVTVGSMLIGAVICGNNTSAYVEIPQTVSRPLNFNHNVNNYHFGGISLEQTAGNKVIKGGATATNIILGIEVLAKVTVPTQRRILIT